MKSGILNKLKTALFQPIQYYLPVGEAHLHLNPIIGKRFSIIFSGEIACIACGRSIKKSYQQGYCFPCTQRLAECDLCILKPERCHYHLGTCRDPEWGQKHCMVPHIVYLANTSGLKVGITRETQIPTRWIDQGATEALPIARTESRYQAGLMEVFLAQYIADKTNWRKMLLGDQASIDLKAKCDELKVLAEQCNQTFQWISKLPSISVLQYPVLEYPKQIKSVALEEEKSLSGILWGVKGQYLILDSGVINIRALGGYKVTVQG